MTSILALVTVTHLFSFACGAFVTYYFYSR